MKKKYLILSIDTSCDETAAAITKDDKILSNIVFSQIKSHQKWGGVVPNIAKREHQRVIASVIQEAFKKSSLISNFQFPISKIDALAVTIGPGLAPALEVGIAKTKELAKKWKKPVIKVNHMEGHLLSSFAKNSKGTGPFSKTKPQFPILGLLVSGGHTQLVLMKKMGKYKLVGETLDDAAGEAFDKVAKMLNLGYPGGPIVTELAKKGKPKYELPIPMKHSPTLDFSFSGLKTACLYKIKEQRLKSKDKKQFICDFCASFEKAVIEALVIKLKKAIEKYGPKQIVLGGGVISNLNLRNSLRKTAKNYGLATFIPYTKKLFTDNAGMIGIAAYYQAKKGDFVKEVKKLDRLPSLNF